MDHDMNNAVQLNAEKKGHDYAEELLIKGLSRNVIILGLVSLLHDSEMIFPLLPACITVVLGAGQIALGVVEGLKETRSFILEAIRTCDPPEDAYVYETRSGRLPGRC